MIPMRELLLYTTLGCHLCEQAEAITLPLLEQATWQLRLVEIADDEALMARYGTRIPVLYRPDLYRAGEAACELGWPFDAQSVSWFLAQTGPGEQCVE